MTHPDNARYGGERGYVVCVFGGVVCTDEGRYKAVVSVNFADGDGATLERSNDFETAEEAEKDYRQDGRAIFKAQVRVLEMLADLHPTKAKYGLIPMCPLIDHAIFTTLAFITREHYDAMFTPNWKERLQELPELEQDEE